MNLHGGWCFGAGAWRVGVQRIGEPDERAPLSNRQAASRTHVVSVMTGIGSSPEAEVLGTLDAAARALRAGNFAAYADCWAHEPDVSVLHPAEGEWLMGWDEVGPAYAALLAGATRPSPERRVRSVRVSPGGEMAWVTAETTVRPAGARLTLWQTFVLERLGGRWCIVHAHASVPAGGADTPPSVPA